MELAKETIETAVFFGIGVTSSASADVKTLLDKMLQKLLADSQIREDRTMVRINVVARDSEDIRSRLRTKVNVQVKEEI